MIENAHEKIISKHDFALVNELLKKDTRKAPGENKVHLFSGMLYCGDCGYNLVRKNNKRANYHICSTYKKGGECKSHSTSEKALYNAVFETLSMHIGECTQISHVLEYINDMPLQQITVQKLQNQMDDKQAEIEKLELRQIQLYEHFTDEIISKSEYANYKEVYAEQTETANKAMKAIKSEHDSAIGSQGENSLWINHFTKYQNMESLERSVIVELIERITVFTGGKIQVDFRYQSSYDDALRYIKSLPQDAIIKEGAAV